MSISMMAFRNVDTIMFNKVPIIIWWTRKTKAALGTLWARTMSSCRICTNRGPIIMVKMNGLVPQSIMMMIIIMMTKSPWIPSPTSQKESEHFETIPFVRPILPRTTIECLSYQPIRIIKAIVRIPVYVT